VYTWIWRRLPGGLPGKLAGSLLLLSAAVLLLFFVVFPAVEPLLPFNDVTVEEDSAGLREELAPGPAFPPL
jgi:hypothetical protein